MADSNLDPPLPAVELSDFSLPGQGLSALLIHGLTGTPYEMRYLGERLAAAGIRVHGVKLAGHASAPEALGATSHTNWYESVIAGFERLRAYGDPIVVAGLSMGALLGARLAIEQPEGVVALAMLSPALFIPRRAQLLLRLLRPLGREDRIYFRTPEGADIHDAAARQVHPGSRLLPLRAALNLLVLSAHVRQRLRALEQPVLLIHSRQDHVCPFGSNTRFLTKRLRRMRLVALDE
ncbi:MAG: alpha/beta hydrolase, partial [Candidatus Binataceae bacterium]